MGKIGLSLRTEVPRRNYYHFLIFQLEYTIALCYIAPFEQELCITIAAVLSKMALMR